MQTGSFGEVVFEVSANKVLTPSSFSFERGTRYEDHAAQGNFEVAEFLAPSLGTASLGITLRRDMGVEPFEEMEKLEMMLIDGVVAPLIIAGQRLGDFTLRKISQDWQYMTKSPGPYRVNATLELKEYY